MSLFGQMTQAGLDLPQTFRAMILLNNLPPEYNCFTSTIVQTITIANFDMQHMYYCCHSLGNGPSGHTKTSPCSDFLCPGI